MSDKCLWQQIDENSDCWSTSCGNEFNINDGTPRENRMRYCCFCGTPISGRKWRRPPHPKCGGTP